MKKLKVCIVISLLFLCAVLVFGGKAYALNISPGSQIDDGLQSGISTPDNSDITAYLESEYELGLLLYKAEADPFKEEGSLAGSYNTIFKNTASDPSGAEINHVFGEPFITDAYLVVKDGNHTPWWYLFDLASWNGTDNLYLSNFWPNKGAISYVGLYGKASVPEPSTVFLLGLGLVGLAGIGRKRLKT
jgi:hypothetical protein